MSLGTAGISGGGGGGRQRAAGDLLATLPALSADRSGVGAAMSAHIIGRQQDAM